VRFLRVILSSGIPVGSMRQSREMFPGFRVSEGCFELRDSGGVDETIQGDVSAVNMCFFLKVSPDLSIKTWLVHQMLEADTYPPSA
jgi:hypothetical protein